MDLSQLSISDQAELLRFTKVLKIIRDGKEQGASREASIRKACLEVYGNEFGDERHVTGEEGVRDTQHPCADFALGAPHQLNSCEGDGHYLCGECRHKKIADPEDETKSDFTVCPCCHRKESECSCEEPGTNP